MGTFYNDFEGYNDELDNDDDDDDDDEDDDEFLLVDDRNWRTFRKNLSLQEMGNKAPTSVSKENEEILESQSKLLYSEYKQGVWAHETSTVCTHKSRVRTVRYPGTPDTHVPSWGIVHLFCIFFFANAA